MEIRTFYVAFPGTSYEISFKTEEECRNHEQLMAPKMWDEKGNLTLNAEEAMFVKIESGMVGYLFDKYGKQNFPGIDEADYGYFYWDDCEERFLYLCKDTIKRVHKFMNEHEIVDYL